MPPRAMPGQAGPGDPYGRYDEPTGTFGAEPARGYDGPPAAPGVPARGPGGPGRPALPPRPGLPPGGGPGMPPGGGAGGPGGGPRVPDGYDPEDRFNGFEPGRHGKMDMTAEIRLPDRDPRSLRNPGASGPPTVPAGQPVGGPPPAGPPMSGPPAGLRPPGAPTGAPGGDMQRVDQIRRTFQVRRFGSGYDPDQVDRMFDEILSSMAGRGPLPVSPADLDAPRFGLVPGGYFEAEVDAALKEVRDILFRR
ncbi:cell division protein DivIVA, partial [Plantactinospora siamensis]